MSETDYQQIKCPFCKAVLIIGDKDKLFFTDKNPIGYVKCRKCKNQVGFNTK